MITVTLHGWKGRLFSLIFSLSTIFLLPICGFAQNEDFAIPPLTSPVMDSAKVMSPQVKQQLEAAVRHLKDVSGTQITVLTVDSLHGLPIEQASIQVTDKWQLGDKKTDRGLLFLLAVADRKIRIEVGQGLEGLLTDAYSKRIIANVMAPAFKNSDYDTGIASGVLSAARLTDPEVDLTSYFSGYASQDVGGENSSPKSKGGFRSLIPILFFILFILFNGFGGSRMRRHGFFFPGMGGGGRGGGGFGGWSGGGGGFSGGGASGDW